MGMLVRGKDYELVCGKKYNPHGRKFRLLKDFEFFYRTTRIVIPSGYTWDGPTGVPMISRFHDAWQMPALIHDYLYEHQGQIDGLDLSQEEVDELFFYQLTRDGVSPIYPTIMRMFLVNSIFKAVWDDTSSHGAADIVGKYLTPLKIGAVTFGLSVSLFLLYKFGLFSIFF